MRFSICSIKRFSICKICAINHEIQNIKKQVTKNSPALALLGPIGTASIVLKEQQLEEKLLQAINTTGNILSTFVTYKTEQPISYVHVQSITEGLKLNQEQLNLLQQ